MLFEYDDCCDVYVRSALLLLGSKEPAESEWEDRGVEIHYLNDPIQGGFDLVAVSADNIRDAKRAAQRLENVFHLDARACDRNGVEEMFRKHRKEFTENFNCCMKSDVSGWKPVIHSARVKKTGDSLVVRQGRYDAAELSLDDGKLSLSRLGCDNAPRYGFPSPFSGNGFPSDLRKWLSGFLPDTDAVAALLKGMDEWDDGYLAGNVLSDAGLFAFLRRFGTRLAGTVQFANPEWLGGANFDRCGRLFLDTEKPVFPEAIGAYPLHSVIFPGQTNGFCADFCGGAWESSSGRGSGYVIPIDSYGRERMAWRILSLAMASVLGIPSVPWKFVEIPVWKKAPVRAIAFSRFDLRAGAPVSRHQLKGLPDDERASAMSALGKADHDNLLKRAMLGHVLGFDGLDAVILTASPEVYSSREIFDDDAREEKRPAGLAPFQGAAAKRIDRMIRGIGEKLRNRGMDFGDLEIDGFLEVETWGCLRSPDLWRTAASFAAFSCPELGSEIGACGRTIATACEKP